MMRVSIYFLAMACFFISTMVLGQAQILQEKENNFAVIKNMQGDRVEGYLHYYPKEITVSTKDDQEKSVPIKLIESIKLEKMHSGLPGAKQRGEEEYYKVRLHHSQEIFTLRKRFTFSLNTSLGVVTQTIDPERVQGFFRNGSSPVAPSKSEQPFIRDKNAVLSLEIKF